VRGLIRWLRVHSDLGFEAHYARRRFAVWLQEQREFRRRYPEFVAAQRRGDLATMSAIIARGRAELMGTPNFRPFAAAYLRAEGLSEEEVARAVAMLEHHAHGKLEA
jgi:hypothetical protein